MDGDSARALFVGVLRHAHAGELAAGHAYRGHAASVSDPEEKARIRKIEDEEWVHRKQVGEMLAAMGEAPDPVLERKFLWIGKTIAILCRVGGWYVPMYGAGRLESHNVKEYEDGADFAVACGHPEFVECLLEMAEVEWEHEAYFRSNVESHWFRHVIPVWPAIPPKDEIRRSFAARNPAFADSERAPLAGRAV
ncbi:MAG: demethoxyubiquinone hydroxylase family protein [Thermoanaerobaculia bacterium]|nr:demethoxyubiquinone hydroxylase family protein [Thermoanaerobaculia bacterium]